MAAQCVGLFLSTAMTMAWQEIGRYEQVAVKGERGWSQYVRSGVVCWNVICFFLGVGAGRGMQRAWGITSAEVGMKGRVQFFAIRYDSWLHSHLT